MKFDGNRLKEQRKKCGLSLDKLAKSALTSKSYVWELENNPELEPSGKKIFLMSQALNVPMDYFYGVDLDNTKQVLGTLISWLGRELGHENAGQLLKTLNGLE